MPNSKWWDEDGPGFGSPEHEEAQAQHAGDLPYFVQSNPAKPSTTEDPWANPAPEQDPWQDTGFKP